ncbi:unnamed protein product [Schistosoma curassoni]|uniref:MULE domain-containing protein n=1 Tax=Schistosoma curassoni TaxID=6186 RepID=A0A183K6Z6_9TREM|nr:unnamed protein product [Schistosoma curassoni]
MIHNHPCDEKCLKNDPWSRRLSEVQLKVVLPMVKTGRSAESIVKYAEENFEKTRTVHYVNNLKYKFFERKLIPYIYGVLGYGSLNDVIATLPNKGKLFVSYGGFANQVTKIALNTHEQIVTYKRLPEVVFGFNIQHEQGKLVCTDNCRHGVPVMFAWTKEEKKFDIVWILDNFKKIMNGTTHLQMPEFTGMLCSSLYHELVDLVLKLCCRWTWQTVQDVDGNIPAIPSPDYNETNRLYRTLLSKIHTLSIRGWKH